MKYKGHIRQLDKDSGSLRLLEFGAGSGIKLMIDPDDKHEITKAVEALCLDWPVELSNEGCEYGSYTITFIMIDKDKERSSE